VLLLLSGWYIYSPGTAPFFKGMESARLVHFVCMWIFLCTGVFHGYDYFVTGRFPHDSFHLKDVKDVPYALRARYFLLEQEDGRFVGRFGPLEKLTYEITFILSALMVVSGLFIYYGTHPTSIGWFNTLVFKLADIGGGLQNIKALHLLIAWFFAVYLAIHIYFFLTEDAGAILDMFFGRKETGTGKEA
jgi:Ni/Fe-hydrogenase b-type cytochrome subunit